MKTNIRVVPADKCTGCSACSNLCPCDAIQMRADAEGFLSPTVDDDRCIQCGKCEEACPALHPSYPNDERPDCYAFLGTEDIRGRSSSGGAFSYLSDWVLQQNGIVCGAVFSEDYRSVHHVLTDNTNGLAPMRQSKYLQSDMGTCYKEIRAHLKNNRYVLFSGCPCEVAGLRAHLGRDYDNLLLVDLICNSAPSPLAWRAYVNEVSAGRTLIDATFRDKRFGWKVKAYLHFSDGSEYVEDEATLPWIRPFIDGIITRKSCHLCSFARLSRQGDITLGDFWGVSKIDPSLNDGRGTSLLTLNNTKGQTAFAQAFQNTESVTIVKVPFLTAIDGIPTRYYQGQNKHPGRETFFRNLQNGQSYSEALNTAKNCRYDFGILGWWYAKNYGAALTSFALYSVVESLGYKTVLLDCANSNYRVSGYEHDDFSLTRSFVRETCSISELVAEPYSIYDMNFHCDGFIVGSDQLWSVYPGQFTNHLTPNFLDFANSDKVKISYATSFGNDNVTLPKADAEIMKCYVEGFDAVSVREESGARTLHDLTGIHAKVVLDPVLVCDPELFRARIKLSKLTEKNKMPYIFAYLLSYSHEKECILKHYCEQTGYSLVLVGDMNCTTGPVSSELNFEQGVGIDDWLCYIANAALVITDSFHGVCLSIVFKREFIGLMPRMGGDRFITVATRLGLKNRVMLDYKKIVDQNLHEQSKIDYVAVEALLKKEKKESMDFLISALSTGPKRQRNPEADILRAQCRICYMQCREMVDATREYLQMQISNLKNEGLVSRMNSKVSIVIPVYNGSDYLSDAINSALAQTYPNIEILVINDGSTDNGQTEALAKSYGSQIRYYWKPNGGVATALNLGIEKMTGEYFAWLSHDDMYKPEKIANEMNALLHLESKKTIVIEGYEVVNSKGLYLYSENLHDKHSKAKLKNGLYPLLRGGVNGCCMLIHKSHFERAGIFDPTLPTTQDYDLFFRLLRGQEIIYLHTCNVLSREHAAQGSRENLEAHVQECDRLWIGMMQKLTDEERVQLDGSVYAFYANVYDFLSMSRSYPVATQYAHKMTIETSTEEYLKTRSSDALKTLKKMTRLNGKTLQELINLRGKEIDSRPTLAVFGFMRNPIGGLDTMQMELMQHLSDTFRFIYLYFVSDGDTPEKYRGIYDACLIPEPSHDATILAAALVVLQVDAAILSYNCSPEFLNLYPKLKAFGIKSIAWNHEDYFLPIWRRDLYQCLPRRMHCLADAGVSIWINSKSYCAYRIQNNANGVYLPNFVARTAAQSSNIAVEMRKKQILAVGRYDDARKGLEPLLRAFAIVAKQCTDVRLKVVGSYCLNDCLPSNKCMTYHQLIQKLNLLDRIDFLPWQNETERLYAESRVHVLLSVYEGFGLTVVEAAACGTPTVAYEGSGMADIISDGVDGYLVAINDVATAANRILRLLEDETLWTEMSTKAYALTQRYEPRCIIPKWKLLIDNLLNLNPEEFQRFLAEQYAASYDACSLAQHMAQEYENCITDLLAMPISQGYNAEIPNAKISPNDNTFCLLSSRSWRITKPIRAFNNARKCCKGVTKRYHYFMHYLENPAMDMQSDAEILRSHCWRITAPLRKLARPFKKNRS